MGYGGPRVEFYTANQYSNFAAAIDRENAARVRSILHRRNLPAEQEAQRQREAAFRAYERAQADEVARSHAEEAEALERRRVKDERAQRRLATKTRRRSLTAAEVASRRSRHACLCRLAEPRKYQEAMYGSGMIGGAMPHQSGRDGKLPTVGRNGAVYCAGVDRDRIVPSRPALEGTVPPWKGSYSTHHGPHKLDAQMAKEAAAYYCAHPAPQRSASEQDMRQQTLQSIAAEHSMAAQQDGADVGMADASGAKGRSSVADAVQWHRMGSDNVDDEAGSIFSHGSSNGPIAATGNMHLSTTSTKHSVQLHLSRYGGAMTAPRPWRPSKAASENLTLPELADRLVCIQMSKSVVR
ncbi:conserved hypothetical protein [Leishmania major strain Friedlin]|uniref:Uncharacterized protein n=1 Tax=Leishmania major TaxID=5664 RepID=Q4QAD1_LEIMA|nr:conserved hypothetical protein [Leishmania major strain Friedlin]CAG9574683.1 hypothetical_protein_-_conserved [Leishmania major strain Friedlin]CAJ05321.1 conserved hypothetical protein [Leishmania major strain Friedlin]|eukprot:XP_001683717.1 conserved hypothetical protein [Leishmania major strain Friedlin]